MESWCNMVCAFVILPESKFVFKSIALRIVTLFSACFIFISKRESCPIISLFLRGVFQNHVIINTEFKRSTCFKPLAQVTILSILKFYISIRVKEYSIGKFKFNDSVIKVTLECFETTFCKSPWPTESIFLILFTFGLTIISHIVHFTGFLESQRNHASFFTLSRPITLLSINQHTSRTR